ncbi:hypothetical protein ACSZM7_10555 [Aeromonas veronii]
MSSATAGQQPGWYRAQRERRAVPLYQHCQSWPDRCRGARRVIASESSALRRSASYQLLARLGPLLDKLEMVEKLA